MNLEGKIDLIKNAITAIKNAIILKKSTPNDTYVIQGNLSTYANEIDGIVTVNNQSKTVTTNGVVRYDDGYTGLEQVTVNLPLGSKSITANGTYTASTDSLQGYNSVSVSVSPNLDTKTITDNGTYSASSESLDGYSSVTVNVSSPIDDLIDGSIISVDTAVTSIKSGAFKDCEYLDTVVLRSNTVVDLSDDTIFENTPIEEKTGNIYVPDGLVGEYEGFNITWTNPLNILNDYTWEALAYDGTKFVALSSTGYISTSTNGTTWTSATQNVNLGSNSWQSLVYDGTKFVALSSTGYISTSTDGTTWASATQNVNLGNRFWTSLTYGNNLLVALSLAGYISTSTDGTTWTSATQKIRIPNDDIETLTYNNIGFIAISTQGRVITSNNGVDWTLTTSNLLNNNWQALVFDNKKLILLGSYGQTAFSVDGIEWELSESLGNQYWENLVYDGNKFIALSQNGLISYSSYKYNFLPISQLPS